MNASQPRGGVGASGDTRKVGLTRQRDAQRRESLADVLDACTEWGAEAVTAMLLFGDQTKVNDAYRRMVDTSWRFMHQCIKDPQRATYAILGMFAATELDYYSDEPTLWTPGDPPDGVSAVVVSVGGDR